MSLADIIAALQTQLANLQALQAATTSFTQADIDSAVAAAVAPLNAQIAAIPGQVTAAVEAMKAADLIELAQVEAAVQTLMASLQPVVAAPVATS